MHHWNLLLLMSLLSMIVISVSGKNTDGKLLSRQKRYLVFPEGSTLSLAVCMTSQTGLLPGQIYTEGVNWGIAYDLPNDTKEFRDLINMSKENAQRRHRRDLYGKIETILYSMGYNGRDCILRSLCEAHRYFQITNGNLVDRILGIIFRYPYDNGLIGDNGQHHHHYNTAIENGEGTTPECFELFPDCPFSLIDLVLGYYSTFEHPPDT